jgi:hypothetical protein
MLRTLALVLAVSACSKSSDSTVAPPAPAPQVSSATQADFAKDVDGAQQRGTWTELKHKYEGLKLHWTVTRHAALCSSPARCNVSAFPVETGAKHGWLPGLKLTAEQLAKLDATCGKADCELTFDGVVDLVRGSDAEPAGIEFGSVVIVSAKKA